MDTFSCSLVVTGASAVTVAGTGLDPVLAAIREGRSCLQPVPQDMVPDRRGLLWGRAEQFKAADFMPPLKARKFDRGSQFAVATAGLALTAAGIEKGSLPSDRIGIALGCGFGGIANSAEFLSGYFNQGVAGLSPLLFPNTVANAPASNASIEYGLKGPNITFVQRFCSAESAILAACRFIDEGRADVMLAGGVDELTPLMMKGFASMGQLRSYASGFGEGCGMLVLEREQHAAARGAAIKARIGRIATLGLLLPQDRQAGIDRLLPAQRSFDQVTLSGAGAVVDLLAENVIAGVFHRTGQVVGQSLAMGGVGLGVLSHLLQPGQSGLHLAASPEGPYFAISVEAGPLA
jgi:3-oxoacyl-(acyl-carrier-protein) synthase